MVVQVPLKYERPRYDNDYGFLGGAMAPMAPAPMMESSGIEDAVIGHGEVEGPFKELDGLTIERDPSFPVRVTVQFYKATTDGTLADQDVAAIRSQIDRVYDDAEYVGSLVTSGNTGRPTEWSDRPSPPVWAGTWSTGLGW
jgi:hypothetical protein